MLLSSDGFRYITFIPAKLRIEQKSLLCILHFQLKNFKTQTPVDEYGAIFMIQIAIFLLQIAISCIDFAFEQQIWLLKNFFNASLVWSNIFDQ